jgi:AraC-like DNA-binding protein
VTTARPLDRYPLIHTRKPEEMCAALARVYAKPALGLPRHTRDVDVRLNYFQMKTIGLGYTKYGVAVSMVYPESDATLQTFPVHGSGEVNVGGATSPLGPRHGVMASSGTGFAVKLKADYEHCLLLLNTKALVDKLAALTGAAIDRRLRFDRAGDAAAPAAKALRDHFLFLVDFISAESAPLPDLVLAEFEQTLQVMFLHANRHDFSHRLEGKAPDAAPAQVRRAEDYVAANWRQPIMLEDVADAAGVHDIGLFRGFKKRRGRSVSQFAESFRLREARRLLQDAGSSASIAGIALACGFADLGRFAEAYARTFGEQPAETLGRRNGADPPGY